MYIRISNLALILSASILVSICTICTLPTVSDQQCQTLSIYLQQIRGIHPEYVSVHAVSQYDRYICTTLTADIYYLINCIDSYLGICTHTQPNPVWEVYCGTAS